MLDLPADQNPPSAPVQRPAFGLGTLIAVGLWACVFITFTVLGLRT